MILAAGIPSLTTAMGWTIGFFFCVLFVAAMAGLAVYDLSDDGKKAKPHAIRNVVIAIVVTGTVLLVIGSIMVYHAAWVDYVRTHTHPRWQ